MRQMILLFFFANLSFAYENLTPAQVYARLAAGDSVQLLDVREISEYEEGHIAEPTGMPVLTPANMPWSSGVLNEHYHLVPQNIDVIVSCRSGGRSASASAFLESKGYTRIFNMTSGFSGWVYNSRTGGYGDGSGQWIDSSEVTILCSGDSDAGMLTYSDNGQGSQFYCELYKIDPSTSPFDDLPDSSLLFKTTALDKFGLSIFQNDTLNTRRIPSYTFSVKSTQWTCKWYSPQDGWIDINLQVVDGKATLTSSTAYKWLLLTPDVENAVVENPQLPLHTLTRTYPNPFNGSLRIEAPLGSDIQVYDIRGRFVDTVKNNVWQPRRSLVGGVYIVRIQAGHNVVYKKVVYRK